MLFVWDRVGRFLHWRHDKNTTNTKNITDIPDMMLTICSIGIFFSLVVIEFVYNGSWQSGPVKSGGHMHRKPAASFTHVAPLPHAAKYKEKKNQKYYSLTHDTKQT